MAPYVPKIDSGRRPDPRISAWYFSEEVVHLLLRIVSLFRKTFSSHFEVTSHRIVLSAQSLPMVPLPRAPTQLE